MEIEDKVASKEVWEKPYQSRGRDTRADRRGPSLGGMGELIGTVSDGRSILREVVGTVLFFFLISQCIIYQKKASSASKYTKITQSASSIQRKSKPPKPLGTQKVYQGAPQKKTPNRTRYNPNQAKDLKNTQ
jgi:hypothetical protein